jgi:glycosyltransferase involved in cell wall biosynthesis
MEPMIDILMATYNGERFVKQQIDSILAQTLPVRLIMRDDGSTDATLAILQEYAQKYSAQITLLPTESRLGIKGNFSKLMEASSAPYIMLCDQDDVWDKEKAADTLAHLHKMEAQYGKEKPLLVHTDLNVVDRDLHLLHPSFWKYTKLYPEKALTLNRLLVQNAITGCATMFNRPLLRKALPIPEECIMHDWWLGLVASTFGAIGFLNKSTIQYRQHGSNNLGAQKFSWANLVRKGMRLFKEIPQKKAFYDKNTLQARAFKGRYQSDLTPEQQKILDMYLTLDQQSFPHDLYLTFKHKFCKQCKARNAGLILWKILNRLPI